MICWVRFCWVMLAKYISAEVSFVEGAASEVERKRAIMA